MSTEKTYVKIRGAWHEAELGHVLAVNGRPAVKLACTGAVAARGFPEQARRPKDDVCQACREHPGRAAAALASVAKMRAPHLSAIAGRKPVPNAPT